MNNKNIIDRDKLSYGCQQIDDFFDELPSYLDENANILEELRELNTKYDNYFCGVNRDQFEEFVEGVETLKGDLLYIRDYQIRTTIMAYDLAEGDIQIASELVTYYKDDLQQLVNNNESVMIQELTETPTASAPYLQTGAVLTPHAYHDGDLTDYVKTGGEVTTDATSIEKDSLISTDKPEFVPEDLPEPINDSNSDASIQDLVEHAPSAQDTADLLSESISTNNQINNDQMASKTTSEIIEGEELDILSDDIVDDNMEVLDEDEGLFDFGKGIIKTNTDVTKTAPTKVKKSALGIGGGVLGLATMAGAGVMAKKYNGKKEKGQDEVIAEEPKKEEEKEQRKIMSIEDIYEFDKDNKELEEATTNDAVSRDFFNMTS